MSSFLLYLQLGFEHISDLNGYDHILFILALCAIYRPEQWRTILILVTAFTVGHSITLALAALNVVVVNAALIEFLIPVTIFLTSIQNVWQSQTNPSPQQLWSRYGMALFFGLIHGLGFSNFFRSLLGREADIVMPLLAFNIGLEVGQLLIVGVIFAVLILLLRLLKIQHASWTYFISGATAGISVILMSETKFW